MIQVKTFEENLDYFGTWLCANRRKLKVEHWIKILECGTTYPDEILSLIKTLLLKYDA